MLPIFRCGSKERHVFFVFFWKRRCQKVTEVVVLKVFHMFILREDFWLSFFCSKSSEWTTTLIDNISIHNHGTPSYMNLTWIYHGLVQRLASLEHHGSTSWDILKTPWGTIASYHDERLFLETWHWWSLACVHLGSWKEVFWDGKISSLGPFIYHLSWVFWVGDGEFSFCKWEW